MKALPVLVLLAAAGAAPAQEPAAAELRIDAQLASLVAEHGVPALGACVLRGGAVVAIGAAGLRERGRDAAVTVDDLWHLGSCTKAMTATLCARRVATGELDFDATLDDCFPELRESMHEGWRRATLRQLLEHRAGMPDRLDRELWAWLYAFDGDLRDARRRVVDEVLRTAPVHPPGEGFLYSNVGYMVAGALLERLGEAPWEELMRRELFVPLGMADAGFGPPGSAERVDQPRAHRPGGAAVPPGPRADNPAALGPAGTVHASLRSWARFIGLHLGTAGEEAEREVLGPAMLTALHGGAAQETARDYVCGFGLTKRRWAEGPILTHAGSNTMWYAVVWAAPEEDFAVLAVCNEGGEAAERATDAACAALIGRFGPRRARGG